MDFLGFLIINVIRVVKWTLILRVLMSWIQYNPYGTLTRIVHEITEPVLRPCRNLLPRTGMIDFSPLIAFLGLDLMQYGMVRLWAGF